MQRAPHYPECHNLNGLSYESRSDHQSAVASYRLARYAVANSTINVSKSYIRDISINLARSLSRVKMFCLFNLFVLLHIFMRVYIYMCAYEDIYNCLYSESILQAFVLYCGRHIL